MTSDFRTWNSYYIWSAQYLSVVTIVLSIASSNFTQPDQIEGITLWILLVCSMVGSLRASGLVPNFSVSVRSLIDSFWPCDVLFHGTNAECWILWRNCLKYSVFCIYLGAKDYVDFQGQWWLSSSGQYDASWDEHGTSNWTKPVMLKISAHICDSNSLCRRLYSYEQPTTY